VKLPDGRIVTLTRYQEFHGPHELGQRDTPSDYWLEFTNPDNNEHVRWNGRREFGSVALLMDKGAPELLMKPLFGGLYQWNCPDPPLSRFTSTWTKQSPQERRLRLLRLPR
jgi:hypothetical protein